MSAPHAAAHAHPDEVLLSESVRRRIVRVDDGLGARCVRKRFIARSRGRRWREAAKAALGVAASQREARALAALGQLQGVSPALVFEGAVGFGERELVMSCVEGEPLATLLGDARGRRPVLQGVAERLRRAHDAGWLHGDLHEGNVLVGPNGPVLIDWQRARRRARDPRRRIRDVARFEHALWLHGVSIGDRMRVRRVALGLPVTGRSAPDERAGLRAVGHAVEQRARSFARVRTRRSKRAAPNHPRVQARDRRGLRSDAISEDELAQALRAHERLGAQARGRVTGPIGRLVPRTGERVLKCDHRALITAVRAGDRTVVVKEVRKGGWRRRWADGFRGTPARRAWVAAHGLEARRIPTARPLAFVEQRRAGWPLRSWFVQEDLRGLWPVSEARHDGELDGGPHVSAPTPRALRDALSALLVRLHRGGVRHGDLQAVHVLLRPRCARGPEAVLIDCDSVRFVARLRDVDRLHDLTSLDASLADRVLPAGARRAVIVDYAARCRFGPGLEPRLSRKLAGLEAEVERSRPDRRARRR